MALSTPAVLQMKEVKAQLLQRERGGEGMGGCRGGKSERNKV